MTYQVQWRPKHEAVWHMGACDNRFLVMKEHALDLRNSYMFHLDEVRIVVLSDGWSVSVVLDQDGRDE